MGRWGGKNHRKCEVQRLRESHVVILRERAVPANRTPENGIWRAGTTLYRRNDSEWFFLSPQLSYYCRKVEQKQVFISFAFVLFVFIVCYDHRRNIKTQGEGRWTRQGWIIPCLMWSDIFSLSHYKIKEIAPSFRGDQSDQRTRSQNTVWVQ